MLIRTNRFPVDTERRCRLVFVALLLISFPISGSRGDSQSTTVIDYKVFEELPAGEFVGDIARDFGYHQELPVSTLDQLRFSFLTLPAAGDRMYFSIDEKTGVVKTSAVIDHEEVCPGRANAISGDDIVTDSACVIKFDVAVRPIEYFRIIKVRVEIVDVNDNAPVFTPSFKSLDVSEAAEVGTTFVLPEADDADSPPYSVAHYDLVPSSGPFQLTVRERVDGSSQLKLVLRSKLDRETTDSYELTVVAIDGGVPAYTGLLTVNVIVRDANDNSPVFGGNASYAVTINEDVPPGTIVVRVTATDDDIGDNALIRYDLSVETQRDYGHVFAVEPDTGELYTRTSLDFETKADYALYVTASDLGGTDVISNAAAVALTNGAETSLSNQALVVVRLLDVNDNPPRIRVHALATTAVNKQQQHGAAGTEQTVAGGGWQLAVLETVSLGTFVAHVTVDDADSGENGRFLCATSDTSSFALRPIPPHVTEFKLVTVAPLDREQRHKHRFTIICRDNGRPSLTSAVPVEVHIVDSNDHAPEFAHTGYHVTVAENNVIGASLLRVAASDRDVGTNSDIRFRLDPLKPEVARLISVDSVTGLITAATSFDRETLPSIEFDVIAVDGGEPPRSARTKVHLTISDVDDHLPVFSLPHYTFFVSENQPPDTDVGVVTAFDRDGKPFNQFTYSGIFFRNVTSPKSSPGSSDPVPFSIDSTSGKITTLESIDRELKAVYELIVVASPVLANRYASRGHVSANDVVGGSSSHTTCDVTIHVTDVNDNRPIFRFPTTGNDRVAIAGSTQRGRVITRVSSVDADAGLNSQVEYRLSYSDAFPERRIFSVDRKSGEVRLDADLQPSDIGSEHRLIVIATDAGNPPLSERASLSVVIVSGPVAESTVNRKSAWPRSADGDLDNPDDVSEHRSSYGLLSSGDLAVVLAVALGAVLVAITIIIAVVCLATNRRRRRLRLHGVTFKQNGGSRQQNCVKPDGVGTNCGDGSFTVVPMTELGSASNKDMKNHSSSSAVANGRSITSHFDVQHIGHIDIVSDLTEKHSINIQSSVKSTVGDSACTSTSGSGYSSSSCTSSTTSGQQQSAGAGRPVVAFIKGLIEEDNCSPNSCDTNSDSGRGPSSDDGGGDVRRHLHHHLTATQYSHQQQHLQQQQQHLTVITTEHARPPGYSRATSAARGTVDKLSPATGSEMVDSSGGCGRITRTFPRGSRTPVLTSFPIHYDTGSGFTWHGMSPANSVKSDPPPSPAASSPVAYRKSTKSDQTSDSLSWYSTTSRIELKNTPAVYKRAASNRHQNCLYNDIPYGCGLHSGVNTNEQPVASSSAPKSVTWYNTAATTGRRQIAVKDDATGKPDVVKFCRLSRSTVSLTE